MIVGEEIKRLREKREWTQYALGKRAGTTQHCISQIEKGSKQPSRGLLAAIIEALSDNDVCISNDFSSIISLILQFSIPGCRSTNNSTNLLADICVELPSGLKSNINIQKKSHKIHDPITQFILNSVLEDLTLRDSIHTILNNDDLRMYLIEAGKNSTFKRILKKLHLFTGNPTQLAFFEAYLDTLLKKA